MIIYKCTCMCFIALYQYVIQRRSQLAIVLKANCFDLFKQMYLSSTYTFYMVLTSRRQETTPLLFALSVDRQSQTCLRKMVTVTKATNSVNCIIHVYIFSGAYDRLYHLQVDNETACVWDGQQHVTVMQFTSIYITCFNSNYLRRS